MDLPIEFSTAILLTSRTHELSLKGAKCYGTETLEPSPELAHFSYLEKNLGTGFAVMLAGLVLGIIIIVAAKKT
jgi:hypothetical protein